MIHKNRSGQGSLVGSATVTGEFNGDFNEPDLSEVTDGSGTAVFISDSTKKGRTMFEFCLTNVEHESLTFQPGDDCTPY